MARVTVCVMFEFEESVDEEQDELVDLMKNDTWGFLDVVKQFDHEARVASYTKGSIPPNWNGKIQGLPDV